MPVSSATLRLLMEAGLEGDSLLGIVASIDADHQEKERSSAAIRQARYRSKKKTETITNDVTRDVTESVTKASPPRARVEDSSSKKDITGKKRKDEVSPQEELETVLDPEHATALVDHRKRMGKGKALTPYAARLLARKLALVPEPNAAADTIIANGWQGFEPEWLENRKARPNGHAPPPLSMTNKLLAACDQPIEKTIDDYHAKHRDPIDRSNAGGDSGAPTATYRPIPLARR